MIKLNDILNEAGGVVTARIQQKPKGYWAVFNKRGQSQFEGDKKFMINILKKASTLSPNAIGSILDRARFGDKHLEFKAQFSRYYYNESVNESDLGLTLKKGKTITVTHKTSGKELVIIDKPNVRKEYEKIGFFAEGNVSEVLTRGGAIELQGQAKYLAQGIKDMTKSYKKKDWAQMEEEVDYIVTKAKLMGDIVKQKRYQESVNEVRWPDSQTARLLSQAFDDAKVKVQKVWEKGNHEYIIRVRAKDGWTNVRMELNVISNVIMMDTQSGHVKLGELQPGSRGRKLSKNLKMLSKIPSFGVAGFKGLKYKIESVNESGLQYRMGVKRYGKEGMTKIQSAAGSGAGHAEIGKIKDKYDKKRKRKKESVEEKLEKYDGGYTHEWNEQRKKNAEVLGYELAGTEDIREEVEPKGNMAKIFKIVKDKQHAKIGGMLIDTFSASALVKIFDAVKDSNKEKLNKMPISKLAYVLSKAFKDKVTV